LNIDDHPSLTYYWTGEFSGSEIDADMLIDQHYYAIASKATILKPDQIPVPKQLFEDSFGLTYESALADGLVFNAKDACIHLGVDAMGYVLYAMLPSIYLRAYHRHPLLYYYQIINTTHSSTIASYNRIYSCFALTITAHN
jgi:hypothetical protein